MNKSESQAHRLVSELCELYGVHPSKVCEVRLKAEYHPFLEAHVAVGKSYLNDEGRRVCDTEWRTFALPEEDE